MGSSLPPCRIGFPGPPGPHGARRRPAALLCVLCSWLWWLPSLQLWAWCQRRPPGQDPHPVHLLQGLRHQREGEAQQPPRRVLFAITDAFQKVIYLGLRLSGVEDGRQRVILYYTEPSSQVSREAAAFLVPVMTHKWNYFAVVVQGEEVTLLVDCEEHGRVPFPRSSQALTFEPSAGIFVGNAGATGLERFIVSSSLPDEEAAGHCSKHQRLFLLSYYPYVLGHAC